MRKDPAFTSFFNDQEAETDLLGFEPYVEALTDFLVDPLTKPPLTISIEGEWGAGKSSFLRQLKQSLKKRKNHYKIEFNPWRYSQDEALWAAFAIEFEKQLIRQTCWCNIISFFIRSLDWKKIATDFLLCLIALSTWGMLQALPLTELGRWANDVKQGFFLASILLGLYPFVDLALQLQAMIVKTVTSVDIKKYFIERPDYKGKIPFLDKFHDDLNRLAKALAGDTRIYIFIDDLDRCQPGQATELMQAINLMLGEKLQAIFIMAIDRKKIAAGIATDNEKYLKALCPNQEPIVFGFEYIDKFIQLPFLLPQPKDTDIDKLVKTLIQSPEVKKEQKKEGFNTTVSTPQATSSKIHFASAHSVQEPESIRCQFDKEIESISEIISELSSVLQHNPRKIKKFLNIWRVQTHLGNRQGLFGFKPPNPNDPSKPITMYQFGKYLGLAYIWPDFVLDWWKYESRKFLTDLVIAGERYYHSDGIEQRFWDSLGSKHKLSPSEKEEYIACLRKWVALPGLFQYVLKNAYEPGRSLDSIPLKKVLTISPVYKEFDLSEVMEDDFSLSYDGIVKDVTDFLNEIKEPEQSLYVLQGELATLAYEGVRAGMPLIEIKGVIDEHIESKNLKNPLAQKLASLSRLEQEMQQEPKFKNIILREIEGRPNYRRVHNLETGQTRDLHILYLENELKHSNLWSEDYEYHSDPDEGSGQSGVSQASDQKFTNQPEYRVRQLLFDEITGTLDEQTGLFDDIGKVFERKNPETGEWEELTEDELPSHPDWQRMETSEDEKDPLDMTIEEAYEAAPYDTAQILDALEEQLNTMREPAQPKYELYGNKAVMAYDNWRRGISITETKKKLDELREQDSGLMKFGESFNDAKVRQQKKLKPLVKHPSYAVEKIPNRPQFRTLIHLPTGKSVTISRSDNYEEDADLLFKKYRPDFDGK